MFGCSVSISGLGRGWEESSYGDPMSVFSTKR